MHPERPFWTAAYSAAGRAAPEARAPHRAERI